MEKAGVDPEQNGKGTVEIVEGGETLDNALSS
jgi:hypothetical protein